MKNKVIIVDDHLLFSQSLKYLIDSFDEFEVIHRFENGKTFINFIQQNQDLEVDLILMDVNMPIMDGLTAMRWLKVNRPAYKSIALSVNDDEDVIIKMIRNGARGYLLKDTTPELFHDALNAVITTGFFFSEMVSGILIQNLGSDEKILNLKDKEIEFIKLACSEKTYREIAVEMCLSPKTVENYREAIFNKLNVNTRIGVVLYAIKNKIFFI